VCGLAGDPKAEKPLIAYNATAQRNRLPVRFPNAPIQQQRYCAPRNTTWPGGIVDPNMSHNDERRFMSISGLLHCRPTAPGQELGHERLRVEHQKIYK